VREEEEGNEHKGSGEEEEEEEDQGAAINLDNSSKCFKILSFKIDGMCIDFISNSESATARVMIVVMF
jgi:hypothetical protein